MAAFAAHALATGSAVALLAGKPGASAAQAGAADSPFAAMLAQMIGGTNPQSPTTNASTSLPANASVTGQALAAASTTAGTWSSFPEILPDSIPSYAQSLGAAQASSSGATAATTQAMAAFPQTRGFISAIPFASPAASAAANASMTAGPKPAMQTAAQLPAFASALSASANAQNPAQQAASSWLQQMMTSGPHADGSAYPATSGIMSANLPDGVASYTGPMGATTAQIPGSSPASNEFGTPSGSQQAAAALSQQMIAARQTASASSGASTPQSMPPVLPVGVTSYTQALSATASQFSGSASTGIAVNPQSSVQQTPASLLQQMISASARVSSSSTQSQPAIMSYLPTGTPSYGQSMNSVPPLFAGVSDANVMATHASSMPQLQLIQPLTPSSAFQTVQTMSSQPLPPQPAASTSGGPWSTASPPAAILSADSTQSVAAMFGVPEFPATMAFAAPAKSQPAVQGGAANAGSPIANASNSVTAVGTGTTVASGNGTQAAQPAAAQSPQPAATATEGSKAETLAQAVEGSVRQGHSVPVTEAQTLPLQLDLSDTKAAAKQDSAHAASNDDSEPDQVDASVSGAPASQPSLSAPAQHSATSPSLAPTLPTATDAPAASAPIVGGAQQTSAGSEQQVPQAATSLPATQAAMPLPAPDVNQLALSIAAKSLDGAKQFDIRLDPAELGRVDVRLSVDSTGTAQAHLAAERPETLALLQSNSGTLTRALQDSGVQVASNGLQFSLKGQERQTEGQQRAPSRNRSAAVQGIAAASAISNTSSTYSLSPAGDGVNILV